MIIDFHTHIFPEKIQTARENYFPGEPAFKLLYHSPKSRMVSAEDMIASMNENGVDKSVVFGFPWENRQHLQNHNDYIIDAVARFPDRLIGFGCLSPYMKDGASEVQRCLGNGLSGIGELAFYQSGIDKEAVESLEPVMEICRQKNVPVLIHTNEPVGHAYPGKTPITLGQIYSLVKAFPENKIVLAHWGGGIFFFNLLKKEVKAALKNVYVDTAASPFLYDPEIYAAAVRFAGKDKILFGSDFPLIPPARYFNELEKTGLSKASIDNICGRNAKQLLHL